MRYVLKMVLPEYTSRNTADEILRNLTNRFGTDNSENRKARINCICRNGECNEIIIVTSTHMMPQVYPAVYDVAEKFSTSLQDCITGKDYSGSDIYNPDVTVMLQRAQEINQNIRSNDAYIYRNWIKRIEENYNDAVISYVISIKKIREIDFNRRVEKFNDTLKTSLNECETLACENCCFIIRSKVYSIKYCIEGYKKHADRIGFYANGKGYSKQIQRMGCIEALKYIDKLSAVKRDEIISWMYFSDMIELYPNPADRLARCIDIYKGKIK